MMSADIAAKLEEARRLEALSSAYDLGRPGWWRGSIGELGSINRRARDLREEVAAELTARFQGLWA
jgi:hypothetical protein